MAQLVISKVFEGETVLICAGPETEARIMETMRSIGLDSLYFHLRGQVTKPALGAMQLAKKKGVKEDTTSPTSLAITQYSRWNEKIAARYSSINRQIFGDLTWQQLAEKAAIGPDPTYKGLLAASLNPSELELSLQEFWHLRERIKKFQRLRVLRTPAFDLLESLHDEVFVEANESEIRSTTQTALEDVVSRGRQLLARVGSLVHMYRRDVSGHHHESLHALRCEIDRLEELIDQGMARYGNEFILESTFNELTGKLKKSISRKYQEMSTARNEVVQGYRDVMTSLQNSAFAFNNSQDWNTSEGLENLSDRLQEMRQYLVDKAREIESNALTHKKRLNAQNISSSHTLQGNIKEVEEAIETFVYWVNTQKAAQRADRSQCSQP